MSRAAPGMNEELLERQAAQAAASERRNRPRWVVLVGGVLLVACGGYALTGVFALGSARETLEREERTAQEALAAAARLRELSASADANPAARAGETTTQVYSRVEAAGVAAGLKNPVPLPTTTEQRVPGAQAFKRNFRYTVRDESLPALLTWVERVVAEVPGLEVYDVELRPEPQQWVMTVQFSRWQRTEGS